MVRLTCGVLNVTICMENEKVQNEIKSVILKAK